LNLTHYNEGQHLIKPRLAYLPLVCLQSTPLAIVSLLMVFLIASFLFMSHYDSTLLLHYFH